MFIAVNINYGFRALSPLVISNVIDNAGKGEWDIKYVLGYFISGAGEGFGRFLEWYFME